jgi:alanine racemase
MLFFMASPHSISSISARTEDLIPAQGEGARLSIDLGAIGENWRFLADRVAPAQCSAVVKADAYGLGLAPVIRALFRVGCRLFFVAYVSEGIQVRQVLRHLHGGDEAVIYVLNGFSPEMGILFQEGNLRPVLGSHEELREWGGFCQSLGERLPAALHIDTGMNRHGFLEADISTLQGDFSWADPFTLALVMSHFISSQDLLSPRNATQQAAFDVLRRTLPPAPASLANSSGIFLPQKPYYEVVRPGYALYGGNPIPGQANPMGSVVRLEARVISVHWVEAGGTVGYDGCWTTDHPRRLCTLSIGYADGYLRAASQTAIEQRMVLIGGKPCPCVGRISMDMCVVDVTHLEGSAVSRGDFAVIIGDSLSVDDVGKQADTIGYEILTHLGRRFYRTYSGEEG